MENLWSNSGDYAEEDGDHFVPDTPPPEASELNADPLQTPPMPTAEIPLALETLPTMSAFTADIAAPPTAPQPE